MTKKQIIQMYRNWRKSNGNQKPNRVIVKMYWEDESPDDTRVDTIGLEPYDIGKECKRTDSAIVLFYASSLSGLLELMKPGNGSEIVVTEVLEFYKL